MKRILMISAIFFAAISVSGVTFAKCKLPYNPKGNSDLDYIRLYTCQTYDVLKKFINNQDLPKSWQGDLGGNQARLQSNPKVLTATQDATNDAVTAALFTPDASQVISKFAEKVPKNLKDAGDKKIRVKFSIASLLGIGGMNTTQADNAAHFIAVLSGQANPISALPENFRQTNNTKLQAYQNEVATYAATQSVGVYVYNHLLQERKINPGQRFLLPDPLADAAVTDKSVGLDPGKDMSQHQIDQYMATRRLTSPGWYRDFLKKATPLQLSRENIILLAEINYQLYQQRMETEQLTATIAAMQLELQQAVNKSVIAQKREQALRSARQETPVQESDDEDNGDNDDDS